MKTLFTLAWRNIWRNKRRTLIASASVFFAVLLSLVMRSMQQGYYDYMIDASVRTYTGHIQIHGRDYWEKRSLEESMTVSSDLEASIRSLDAVEQTVPRLECFALLAKEKSTRVAMISGIVPDLENRLTGLKGKLVEGNYPDINSKGILLGEGLARRLRAKTGDEIVIYGQGYHGVTAAALVPVEGIVKFPIPDQNRTFSYMALPEAQWIFSAFDRITSISIMAKSTDAIPGITSALKKKLSDQYEVMSWKELTPELVQAIEIDNAQGLIMSGILYLVIAFGVFGTVMMMTTERLREFGILISVGMMKSRLIFVAFLETLFVSFMGVIAGSISGLPLIVYYSNNPITLSGEYAEAILAFGFDPIIPFALNGGIFLSQAAVVLIIALFSGLYPLNFIRKIKPAEAVRG